MAGFKRTIHPVSNFAWGKLAELAPDMQFNHADGEESPMALMMVDPDQESHLFVFNEDGRQKLLAALTGGVVIANGIGPFQ